LFHETRQQLPTTLRGGQGPGQASTRTRGTDECCYRAPRHLGGGGGGSAPTPGAEFDRYGGHTSCVAIAHDGSVRASLSTPAPVSAGRATSRKRSRSFQRQALHRGDRARPHALGAHLGAPALRRRQQPRLPGRSLSSRPRGDIESVLERYMISPLPDRTGGRGGLVELPRHDPGSTDISGSSVLALEIRHKGGRAFGHWISDGKTTISHAICGCKK
jgi:hypothetical protein